MKTQSLLLCAVSMCVLTLSARADDWPQFRGPHRDDISHETGLLKTWPADGPPLLWTYTGTGVGYSGPSIVGDHLFIMGGRGDTTYLIALNVQSGKEVWSTKVGPVFNDSGVSQWGIGPRGTPTVDGDRVYALSANGDLVCVERATGKLDWHINLKLKSDLGGQMMTGWGYAESPLVDGEKLVCSPGGSRGTLAALDKKTGKVLWRSKELTDPASYASIVISEAGGVRQYVQMTGDGVVGVAAKDGQLLWRSPLGKNPTAVIPTPLVHEDYVYVTSGYSAGGGLLRLTGTHGKVDPEEVWANKEMQNKHGGVVLVDQHVYGYTEKGRHSWICQDFKTGKVVWSQSRKLSRGSLTCAEGRLYCYGEEDGTVVLINASPDGWQEHGRFKIPKESSLHEPQSHIWTHPVIANGRLYLRDQDLLFCYDLKDHTAARR
jgi:outer membrane protein assembly factor BamB